MPATRAGLETVERVLSELEGSEQSRQVLLKGLPHALGSGAEKHDFQARFLGLVEAALQEAHRSSVDRQAQLKERAAAEKSRLEERQASHAAAAQALEIAIAATVSKRDALKQARREMKAAEAYQKEAARDQGKVDRERSAHVDQRERVSSALEGSLLMLAEGGWEDDEARDAAVEAVCACLQSFGADKVLLAAAPAALSAAPDRRAAFDGVVLQHARGLMEEKLSTANAALEQSACAAALASAEALGAWALTDAAQEADAKAAQEATEAEAAEEAAESARKEAEAAAGRQEEALEALDVVIQEASDRVQLCEQALAIFAGLQKEPAAPDAATEAQAEEQKDVEMGEAASDQVAQA